MNRLLITCLLALATTVSAIAQTRTVKGTVYDANDGEPLPGAAVKLKSNPATGTLTDIDGHFSISVPAKESQLVISFMGKTPQSVPVKGTALKVYLEDEDKQMEELVVLGYGSARKLGTVTGAVAKVGGDKIENTPNMDFTNALQGQVAGVSVLSPSGEPTASAVIRIRGIHTINASSAPLYIMDGAPISEDAFQALNPTDIANITILKDAASTAIYGSRASNGVVVITSKKGMMEMKPEVKLSFQYGFSNINDNSVRMMNSGEYLGLREKLDPSLLHNNDWLSHKDIVMRNGISTKWVDEMYRSNAPLMQATASISGGGEKATYFLSLGHSQKDGIEPLSSSQRESFRLSSDIKVTQWLKIGAALNLSYNISQSNPEQNAADLRYRNPTVFSRLVRPDDAPYYYTVNPDGTINRGARADYMHYSGQDFYSPIFLAEHRRYEGRQLTMQGKIYEELTPIKGLRLRAEQSIEMYNGFSTDLAQPIVYDENVYTLKDEIDAQGNPVSNYYSPMGDLMNPNGASGAGRTEYSSNTIRFTSTNTAEYQFNVGRDHHLNFLVGHESIVSKDEGFNAQRQGLTDIRMMLMNNASETPAVSQNVTRYALNSFFAQGAYDYKDRYNFTASARADGSSRFPKTGRWGTFWSVGARWNMMNEKFMTTTRTWLNQMDFRISYGTTGNNENPSMGDFAYRGTATSAGVNYKGEGMIVSTQSIQDLTWEKTAKFNVGFDTRFLNRLSLTVEYFRDRTSDMLMNIPYSYTTGYSGGYGNVGGMVSHGVEISANVDLLRKKDMYWNFYANITYENNHITELYNGQTEHVITGTGTKMEVGKEYGEFFLVKRAGVDPRDGKQMWYDLNGNLTKEYSEDNAQFIGKSRNAPWYGGFGTSFDWKGLTVKADFTWTLGKYAINQDRYFTENSNMASTLNQNINMLDMWTTPGQVTDIPAAGEPIYNDDHLVENASFLKLRTLTIGYRFQKSLLQKQNVFKGVYIFASANNLFTATKFQGYDPEPDRSAIQFSYPNTRDFLFGCELTF